VPDAGKPDGGKIVLPDAGDDAPALRKENARTADVALYDALQADLATMPDAGARNARVTQFLQDVEAQGGTPLTTSDGGSEVVFLATGTPSTGYSVIGDFNQWTPDKDLLTQVSGTSLYAAELTLPRASAYQYKLVDGSNVFEDLRAHNVVWDGIDRGARGQFNARVYPGLIDATEGRLIAWRGVADPTIGLARDVFIYLPPVYDAKRAPVLPLLVFQDGNESLTRAGGTGGPTYSQVADTLYTEHPEEAAVLAFVDLPPTANRFAQYSFDPVIDSRLTPDVLPWPTPQGDLYLQFLKVTLLPKLEAGFRLCPKPRDRGIGGASLGGLISGYAGVTASDTWGFVGSQSGSYFFNDVVLDAVQSGPVLPVRWYLDTGCPADNCDSNRQLADALAAKGYALTHIEETSSDPDIHDWQHWEARLPFLLQDFRAGLTGCAP
jgi:enterochelin esterase family protein